MMCASEPLRPQQSVGEVEQEPCGHERRERIVEIHRKPPLEPVAGVGVAHRHHEQAEAEGQHDEIQHGILLGDADPYCARDPLPKSRAQWI